MDGTTTNFCKNNDEKNTNIHSYIISLLGTNVCVDTTDKVKYSGIFSACTPTFDIGLIYAQKHPLSELETVCLTRENTVQKIQFDSKNVVCLSGYIKELENKGFVIDSDISPTKNSKVEEKDLEEWLPEEEDDESGNVFLDDVKAGFSSMHRLRSARQSSSTGWSVEEMLKVNQNLGVKTSFVEDLSQYTTVRVEGDENAIKKADEIASSIENNPLSRRYAMLENDDEERNLNEETHFTRTTNNSHSSGTYHYSRHLENGNQRNNSRSYNSHGNNRTSYNNRRGEEGNNFYRNSQTSGGGRGSVRDNNMRNGGTNHFVRFSQRSANTIGFSTDRNNPTDFGTQRQNYLASNNSNSSNNTQSRHSYSAVQSFSNASQNLNRLKTPSPNSTTSIESSPQPMQKRPSVSEITEIMSTTTISCDSLASAHPSNEKIESRLGTSTESASSQSQLLPSESPANLENGENFINKDTTTSSDNESKEGKFQFNPNAMPFIPKKEVPNENGGLVIMNSQHNSLNLNNNHNSQIVNAPIIQQSVPFNLNNGGLITTAVPIPQNAMPAPIIYNSMANFQIQPTGNIYQMSAMPLFYQTPIATNQNVAQQYQHQHLSQQNSHHMQQMGFVPQSQHMLSSQAPSGTSTPNGPSMVSMEMCGHPLASNIPNNIPLVNNNGNGTGSVQMISQQQIAQLACSQQQMPPPQHSMQQQSQQYPQQQNIQRNPQQHFQQQAVHPGQNANLYLTNQNMSYQQGLIPQTQYQVHYLQGSIMHPPPNAGMPQALMQTARYNQYYPQSAIMNASNMIPTTLTRYSTPNQEQQQSHTVQSPKIMYMAQQE